MNCELEAMVTDIEDSIYKYVYAVFLCDIACRKKFRSGAPPCLHSAFLIKFT